MASNKFTGELRAAEDYVLNVVEAKVKASTTASTITAFVVGLLGTLAVFHGAPVPAVVTSVVGALVTGALTFASGWLARHTPRATDVPPSPAPPSGTPTVS